MNGNEGKPLLSVIVPVYNESKIVVSALEKIRAKLASLNLSPYEIVVVSDGSRDGTEAIVQDYIQKNPSRNVKLLCYNRNWGKGFCVAQGMLKAQGHYLFFIDSDLSTPLDYLRPFMEKLNQGADMVIASRFSKDSRIVVDRPLAVRFLSFCERGLIRIFSGLFLDDTQCGFKGFKAEAAKKIFSWQRVYRFCFDVEALFLAKKLNYKVETFPVDWSHDSDTRVRLRDMFIFVWDLIRIRWFWFKKSYQ